MHIYNNFSKFQNSINILKYAEKIMDGKIYNLLQIYTMNKLLVTITLDERVISSYFVSNFLKINLTKIKFTIQHLNF